MAMRGKQAGPKVVKRVGNVLTFLNGTGLSGPQEGAREIQRILSRQGGSAMETKQKGEDGEERKRETFEGGISVEGEFAFPKAVDAFCKEAKKGETLGGAAIST